MESRSHFLSFSWILLLLLSKALASPGGAPLSTCTTLTPLHPGGSIQSSRSPYEVLMSSGQGRIRVILGSPEGRSYKGFMIFAKDAETGQFVGEFKNLPDSARHVECVAGLKNAVTHIDTKPKHNLEFDWEAPADYEGEVIFNSTFAQDYETYWIGVESSKFKAKRGAFSIQTSPSPIMTSSRGTTPPFTSRIKTTTPAVEENPFYEGCGDTKVCFGSPSGCVERKDCKAIVSVLVEGERYIFEMQATEGLYVAVGLSDDEKMGDDSVVECENRDGQVSLHTSWNEGKTNRRMTTPAGKIQSISTSLEDGVITCKFSRDKLTKINGRTFDLVSHPYHLLLVSGKSLKPSSVGYHDLVKTRTAEKALLSEVEGLKMASDILIRIHGALMLVSWIGTASVGMLLARYYRQTWVNAQLCGKDLWFAWHRFFMLLTWLMTIGGFVVIVVELKSWSTARYHSSLGLATTLLCFIQPFMAAMRPHPGASKRLLFNWLHWFVGNVAHICGIMAIFFAVRLNKAQLPEWVDWILVAYVAVHVTIHILLTFAGCASERQGSHRVNSFPMKDMHPPRNSMNSMGNPMAMSHYPHHHNHSHHHQDIKRDAPLSCFRKFFFVVYFLSMAIFATALVLIAVLAPITETWDTVTEAIVN